LHRTLRIQKAALHISRVEDAILDNGDKLRKHATRHEELFVCTPGGGGTAQPNDTDNCLFLALVLLWTDFAGNLLFYAKTRSVALYFPGS
tara:strand:+ start:2131 stop:2400 length:270 start_codon:yes stop_codon:yes gene_type:complete